MVTSKCRTCKRRSEPAATGAEAIVLAQRAGWIATSSDYRHWLCDTCFTAAVRASTYWTSRAMPTVAAVRVLEEAC